MLVTNKNISDHIGSGIIEYNRSMKFYAKSNTETTVGMELHPCVTIG